MKGVELILEFLEKNDLQGLQVIKNIFLSKINKQSFQALKNQQEDLFNEFLAVKIIPNQKKISEKFKKETKGLYTYISVAIENFLKTNLEKYIYLSENTDDIVYIYKEEDENPIEEKFGVEIDFLKSIEGERVFQVMKEKIKEEEKQLLCYMLSDNEKQQQLKNVFYSQLKEDALYKRVERLKKKLTEIVREYEFSKNGVEYFFEIYYKEICIKVYEVNKL
jgi:hypothetical protein